MSLTVVTPAATFPVSLGEAKPQCRVTDDIHDLDSIIELAIEAATERAEGETGRALVRQTLKEVLSSFPNDDAIEIQRPPLISVSSVKYRDGAGVIQTLAPTAYVLEAPQGPRCARGVLSLALGQSWPSTYGQADDVAIEFVCGYGTDPQNVPALLRMAILMDVATLVADPERLIKGTIVAELPGGSRDIYRFFKSHGTRRRAS